MGVDKGADASKALHTSTENTLHVSHYARVGAGHAVQMAEHEHVRPSVGFRGVQAMAGPADPKSNYSSSDNPLANSHYSPALPRVVPPGGALDPKSNYSSADNPLANPRQYRSPPGPARGVPPSGPLDPKSNYSSADNPLARPRYYG